MVGDHLQYVSGEYCVVVALHEKWDKVAFSFIDEKGDFGKKGATQYSTWLPATDFSPIPLTEEILKKNFNFDPNNSEGAFEHYWWSNDYIEVTITEYTDGLWKVEVDEIEMADLPTWKMYVSHVHELQHALRLCGIDKEITL